MTPENLRRQQSILQTHRVLLRAGLGLVSVFAWVFVFEFVLEMTGSVADGFFAAVLSYAVSQAVLVILTPLSAAHLRHGVKRAMLFGALFVALAYAVIASSFAGYFSSPIGWGLILFGLLLGTYRAIYWIPYKLQSTNASAHVSYFFEILLALLPAFAGVTLASEYLSVYRLLFGAAALMLLSIVPIFFLEDIAEPFQWRFLETYAKLFEPRYQTLALRSALVGMESATLFLLWPVAVYLIVDRSYFVFGLVMTASLLILLVLRRVYRDLLRKGALRNSLPLEVAFSVSGWVLRLVAGTPFMIVFADSYSFVSAPAGSAEVFSREHPADAGSYIDEYTALQEIGMGFGRLVMCAFVGVLLFTMPLPVVLALALVVTAFVAGAAAVLAHKIKLHAY